MFRRLDVNGDGKISPDEAEYLVDTGVIPLSKASHGRYC